MFFDLNRNSKKFTEIMRQQKPVAKALIRGNSEHPNLFGTVLFFDTPYGTLVTADVMGLPNDKSNCSSNIFGFHVHEGKSCTGTKDDPFKDTEGHYNPGQCPHPAHAGDMPPLFGANGRAWIAFLTDRFSAEEVIGRTVIIHSQADDFTSQPAGNSGKKIACGQIKSI